MGIQSSRPSRRHQGRASRQTPNLRRSYLWVLSEPFCLCSLYTLPRCLLVPGSWMRFSSRRAGPGPCFLKTVITKLECHHTERGPLMDLYCGPAAATTPTPCATAIWPKNGGAVRSAKCIHSTTAHFFRPETGSPARQHTSRRPALSSKERRPSSACQQVGFAQEFIGVDRRG
jgi:hypothetical protein